jgi:hypothetical protein
MTDASNRSAENIERELERRRSEIDRTISAIQDRLTPEAAFDHALAYMRGAGGQRVLDAVRRNPLAAVIAVVGVGWLLLGMRQPAEDRGLGQPHKVRPQELPPVPRTNETPFSVTTPSASPSPGAAAGGARSL